MHYCKDIFSIIRTTIQIEIMKIIDIMNTELRGNVINIIHLQYIRMYNFDQKHY